MHVALLNEEQDSSVNNVDCRFGHQQPIHYQCCKVKRDGMFAKWQGKFFSSASSKGQVKIIVGKASKIKKFSSSQK